MDNWIIKSNELQDKRQGFLESIFTLGNGYMAVRGFDSFMDGKPQEQCTYIAGLFDYFEEPYTDMVNTPNYLRSKLYIDNKEITFNENMMDKHIALNMKEGILSTEFVLDIGEGKRLKIEEKRFLSMANNHKSCLHYQLTPINFSGNIGFETGIDYDVANSVIHDDQTKEDIGVYRFLELIHCQCQDQKKVIHLRTKKTSYDLVEAFTCVSEGLNPLSVSTNQYEALRFNTYFHEGETKSFYKYISVFTSRDVDVTSEDDLVAKSMESLDESLQSGYLSLEQEHIGKWEKLWNISNVSISGHDELDKKLRYNIFQLIQNNASNNPNVNIGARGLTHGRYKGCYFWDTDIFMLPFYTYTHPEAAKNLLLYRYKTLDDARQNAMKQNVSGARYPWMCTIDGSEQCDTWDIGFSEIHITADIAYAIQHYYEATKDIEFMKHYGLEMLVETARYWCSRFTYNALKGCYNLLWVKGPNEYGGVTVNNTYTVMMACYNIEKALEWINYFAKEDNNIFEVLAKKINFKDEEIDIFREVLNKAVILYDEDKQLYIEDEHFMDMEPLDLKKVKVKDTALYKKICFDRLQRYQVVKQADIILLMLLLPHKFKAREMEVAWNFYEPLTTHDSSLSFATHAQMGARIQKEDKALNYLYKSVALDYDNIMDNTQKEGLHVGSFGATWLSVIGGFAGIYLKDGEIQVEPNIPKDWGEISFKLYLKGSLVQFTLTSEVIIINLIEGTLVDLYVNGENLIVTVDQPLRKEL